jgi:DNA mismatch repair protein MutL
VNDRFVRDKTIAGGLLEGYRSVLPHGVYPVAFLFLDVPLEEIDVNVHPAKTEIRFRRNEAVKDVIAEAIRGALAQAGIVAEQSDSDGVNAPEPNSVEAPIPETAAFEQPKIEFASYGPQSEFEPSEPIHVVPPIPDGIEPPVKSGPALPGGRDGEEHLANLAEAFERAAAIKIETDTIVPQLVEPPAPALGGSDVLPPFNSAERLVKTAEVESISGHKIRPIGQLHESFIIAVDDEGLLLIDQHVAHERILFDKFRRKESERGVESQNMLLPETFDLTPGQSQAFQIVEEELAAVGFGVMRLSGRTVAIKSIPTDLPPSETRNLFAEILDNVELDKRGSGRTTLRDDIAASLACKAAVKINMPLTPEKMSWMIDRLLQTSSPTTCPHGRPVILRLSMRDIEKGFHRT